MSTEQKSISAEGLAFHFARPEPIGTLSAGSNTAIAFGALAERMAEELRTRVWHRNGERENNAEHSFMLSKVAPMITQILFPDMDHNLVARFATVHDDLEAYVGDTPTDRISLAARMRKQELESLGLDQLTKEYGEHGDYVELMHRYEAQIEPEARAVRMIDKLMPLLVHINDDADGVIRKRQSAVELRQNAARESQRLRQEYGHDMGAIIDLRDELAEHIAQMIESRPDQYLF